MEFETQAQRACYEKVLPWMKELFGEFAIARDDIPAIGVFVGSAVAQVVVYPWGDDDAVLCTRAYVVTGAELTPDLMYFLLRENADMRFGAFGVDSDDDIFFEHTIVGSTCDKNELKASVMTVVMIADHYDDQIVARWGGQRALERMA
ncbi:MAG: YbjN domain-containing protein [Abditibacteriales bacterium]|nr:YbjN domain-containing protein [Abditibacteriales bacterium]